MCRKATCFIFAVDQSAVCFDVKHASTSPDQLDCSAGGVFHCGRQTGGLRRIVSHDAVSDANVHFNTSGSSNADNRLPAAGSRMKSCAKMHCTRPQQVSSSKEMHGMRPGIWLSLRFG